MTKEMPSFTVAGITATFDGGISTVPTERGFENYQQLEKENNLSLRMLGSYYWNNLAITVHPARCSGSRSQKVKSPILLILQDISTTKTELTIMNGTITIRDGI